MSNPTRFFNGVATARTHQTLHSFPFPDPYHTASVNNLGNTFYSTDFQTLGSSEYTVTGSSSTLALANGFVGGAAVLTPGGATTASSAYKNGTSFQFQAGNRFWYTASFQLSAVSSAATAYVGLQAGSSANDGIWFYKPASSATLNLVSVVGGTSTTLLTNIASLTAATIVEVGLYYNGTDLLVYTNDYQNSRVTAPTIGASATTLTNAVLTPVVQITPAATETLTVDFILASQEMVRPVTVNY